MKPSKSRRNFSPARERVATQRLSRASKLARLPRAGGKSADRAGSDFVRARRKGIRLIVVAILHNARPIGAFDSLILSVLRDLSIQCSETELRRELCALEHKGSIRLDRLDGVRWLASLAGPETSVAEGDAHIAARTIPEKPLSTRNTRKIPEEPLSTRNTRKIPEEPLSTRNTRKIPEEPLGAKRRPAGRSGRVSSLGARRRPAGKVARGDSRRSGRVSR